MTHMHGYVYTRCAHHHISLSVLRVNAVPRAEVASQAVISHLRAGAGGFVSRQFQSYLLPYGLRGFPKQERGDFTFSVIREPLEAARAAYLEVSRRRPAHRLSDRGARGDEDSDDGSMSYRSISCADGPRSAERMTERYLAFLHDVERGRDLGPPRSMCSGPPLWCATALLVPYGYAMAHHLP